ncbi:MAG: NAD-dependent dehydratase, partial [Lacunisphaera sp.]|nr:NAD-dependent dehydratase [Lacunisphaera sp.]
LEGVTSVIHTAARVHVMNEGAVDALDQFLRVNRDGTRHLAECAAQRGVQRLVFVSSIKVNGESTGDVPFRADDAPAPVDPYGISKWEAEQALWRVAQSTPLEVVAVRPPLVYGPGAGGNVLRLLNLLRAGAPLPLASVRNRRSIVYVDNLASALIACASHPRAAGNTYLVSDGDDLSTPELITELAAGMGCRARLLPLPAPLLTLAGVFTGKSAEIGRLTGSLTVDSSGLCTSLGWTPPYNARSALRQTGLWFASHAPRLGGGGR